MTGWGRARVALIALAFAAILFVFVFPTRSYLAQRRQVANAQRDVAFLRQQNDKLEVLRQQLRSPAAIERMGRQQFHLIFPGEHVYYVMTEPAPAPTTTVP